MKRYVEKYMHELRTERRLSANTLAAYERDLLSFAAYAADIGIAGPQFVQRHHMSKYTYLLKEEGRKPSTLSRHIVTLRAFFHYFAAEGMIVHNPAVSLEAPRKERKLPGIISVADASALLSAPETVTDAGKRDRAMLELIYATGIRVSELMALNVESVNLQVGFIVCTSSGQRERVVPFAAWQRMHWQTIWRTVGMGC